MAFASLGKHHPRWITSECRSSRLRNVKVPSLASLDSSQFLDLDFAEDLEEWLGLLSLSSPRTQENDKANPFICRYSVPSVEFPSDEFRLLPTSDLLVLHWHGFLPTVFILTILLQLEKTARTESWWTLRSSSLHNENKTLSVLKLPSEHTKTRSNFLCWHHPG